MRSAGRSSPGCISTLEPSHGGRLGSRRPSNSDAWDAYLRARFFWNRRTHDDMSRAIEWYERAIELDPSSPLVYAGLADVYATLGPPNTPISQLIERGTMAANKAIALDPTMGEPFGALGKLRAYDWDWAGAERNYRKSIETHPVTHRAVTGTDRSWPIRAAATKHCCRRRPPSGLDPVSLPGNMVIAGVELKCGRVEQAIRRNNTILEFDPGFGQSVRLLSGARDLMQGNISRQRSRCSSGRWKLTGGRPTIEATLGVRVCDGRADRRGRADCPQARTQRHQQDKVLASAWSVAIAEAGLGNGDAALTWLEHWYRDREEWLEMLAVDERFRRLHSDERFQRLLRNLRLPGQPLQMVNHR